jgi:hypothetical protein
MIVVKKLKNQIIFKSVKVELNESGIFGLGYFIFKMQIKSYILYLQAATEKPVKSR